MARLCYRYKLIITNQFTYLSASYIVLNAEYRESKTLHITYQPQAIIDILSFVLFTLLPNVSDATLMQIDEPRCKVTLRLV